NGGRRFCQYLLGPFISCIFQFFMRYYGIDHSHIKGFLSSVIPSEKKYFPGFLLSYHFSEIGTSITSIKTCYICICLFKDRMLFTGKGKITNYVKTMPATNRPSRHNRDHRFWHESNESLHF